MKSSYDLCICMFLCIYSLSALPLAHHVSQSLSLSLHVCLSLSMSLTLLLSMSLSLCQVPLRSPTDVRQPPDPAEPPATREQVRSGRLPAGRMMK